MRGIVLASEIHVLMSVSGSVNEQPLFFQDCVRTGLVEECCEDMGVGEEFLGHCGVWQSATKSGYF